MDLKDLLYDLCFNPKHTKWMSPLAVVADAALCALIILKVPYTEIDWTTYMQQISLYLAGERDYTAIKGSTGPLVYPAGHVYIYTLLHHLTDGGRDIFLGQIIFAALYLVTLVVVLACYRRSGAPPFLLPLLVLSKRLHSVFVLRLFNDGFAALAMWVAVYLFQTKRWTSAVVVWSLGLSVKMTLLLLAPAVAAVLALSLSIFDCIRLAGIAVLIQVLLAMPFLLNNPAGYLSRAFELTRQFMFKWTVNWRFVGEETFLSRGFSLALMVLHVSLLLLFITRVWLKPSGSSVSGFVRDFVTGQQPKATMSGAFIMTTLLSSLATGLLCARSLHYQFFAYLSWAAPFLLWQANLHPIGIVVVWAAQEWAWNTYPSTNASSAVVVLSLAIQAVGTLVSAASDRHLKHRDVGHKQHAQ